MGVSCCGQAKDQSGVVTNSQPFLGAGPGIIDSQPTYQPVLNYNNNNFQPPSVPSPPVAHPHDHNPFANTFQPPMREFGAASPQQTGPTFTGTTYNGQPPFQQTVVPTFTGTSYNGQPPSQQHTFTGTTYNGQPPMREFGASSPPQQTAVPNFTGTTYNGGSNFNSINQSITRPKSSHSPHSPPPQVNTPIQDEGKMSISIDFGMYSHVSSLHSLILVQAQRSLVL